MEKDSRYSYLYQIRPGVTSYATLTNGYTDNIEKMLNTAYFDTWRYIQLRMGYWKEKVYRTKTKKEMIDDAFGRWRKAGKLEK